MNVVTVQIYISSSPCDLFVAVLIGRVAWVAHVITGWLPCVTQIVAIPVLKLAASDKQSFV